ncbi:hypothetical protein [Helicobacter pylori]|uniref:hypothetical protein n=1 Tax=Helicobacter pylori TaxID=210 RepID=UPI001FF1F32F|nr:hypothetical protein [Helicobacter pylori]MCK0501630.1 hypothetical protein [Helicobacter pylori]
MKLYNKIQELINESESLKQKNNEVLGLAKNELSDLVNTKAKENLESLKNEFQGYLDGKLIEMPIIVKKNVEELFNKEALTKEIHNELLSQFDKQAIANALRQELKNEIKSDLDNLLSDSELQKELQQAKKEIITETTSGTTNALTSKILGILESKLDAITESVIKNLDFSFLSAQPKAFYGVINKNLKEMFLIFLKEFESEFLKKYIKESIDNTLAEAEKFKTLRLTELKALCYLQVTLESLKVQSLQNALMLEADIMNSKMKIENEIAYNLKRKELIEDGKLEDKAFKKNIFKVI